MQSQSIWKNLIVSKMQYKLSLLLVCYIKNTFGCHVIKTRLRRDEDVRCTYVSTQKKFNPDTAEKYKVAKWQNLTFKLKELSPGCLFYFSLHHDATRSTVQFNRSSTCSENCIFKCTNWLKTKYATSNEMLVYDVKDVQKTNSEWLPSILFSWFLGIQFTQENKIISYKSMGEIWGKQLQALKNTNWNKIKLGLWCKVLGESHNVSRKRWKFNPRNVMLSPGQCWISIIFSRYSKTQQINCKLHYCTFNDI